MARPLSEAMLRYLKEPELMTTHRAKRGGSSALGSMPRRPPRFAPEATSKRADRRRPDQGSTLDLQDERDSWSTRQSA